MSDDVTEQPKKSHKATAGTLLFIVIGMFGFGFALVPLYKLVCQIEGFNGIASAGGRVAESDINLSVDKQRVVRVEFDATVNTGLPWKFHPMVKSMDVHPGEINEVSYYAENISDEAVIGRAIPGVTPWQVTQFLSKMECFCFNEQKLLPGEGKEMPIRFVLSPEVPAEYETVTLSYMFMNIDRSNNRNAPASADVSKNTQTSLLQHQVN